MLQGTASARCRASEAKAEPPCMCRAPHRAAGSSTQHSRSWVMGQGRTELPCPFLVLFGIFCASYLEYSCFVCASLSSSLYVCFSFMYQHHSPTFMRLAPGPTVQAHTFTSARKKQKKKKQKQKKKIYIKKQLSLQ